MVLSQRDYEILRALDEQGGWCTGDLTAAVDGERNRVASAFMRSCLLSLKGCGLVAYLDDNKPVAWVRTPEGTAEMRRHEEEAAEKRSAALSALAEADAEHL